MFKPEKEVPSLELCKHLKELGYPQEGGGWYWKKWKDKENWNVGFVEEEDKQLFLTEVDFVKAPTCRELGEWLPLYLDFVDENSPYNGRHGLITWKGVDGWWVGYIPYNCTFENFKAVQVTGKDWRIKCWDEREVNARAKMLIWLAENGYLDFKKKIKGDGK